MVEPSKKGGGCHRRVGVGRSRRCDGHGLTKALVRSRGVEVPDVLSKDALEVPLSRDEEMVKALAPGAADEPLAQRIGLRCSNRGAHHANPDPFGDSGEEATKLAIPIPKEELGAMPVGCRVAKLLRHPPIPGRSSYAEVDDPASGVVEEEEREQGPEAGIVELDEVARPDALGVLSQEGRPPPEPLMSARRTWWRIDDTGGVPWIVCRFSVQPKPSTLSQISTALKRT